MMSSNKQLCTTIWGRCDLNLDKLNGWMEYDFHVNQTLIKLVTAFKETLERDNM